MIDMFDWATARIAIALVLSVVGLGTLALVTKKMRQNGAHYSATSPLGLAMLAVVFLGLGVYGLVGLPRLMSVLANIPAGIQLIVLCSVLVGAYILWRKRKISNVTGVAICLILLGFMSQLASFDRVYRRPVPEEMLRIEIPTTERIYLLRGMREDVLEQSSLFGLHQLTIDIEEAQAEAGLRHTYRKTSPLWKKQHAIELIEHLKGWEKTGPLHTPFPILAGMRQAHGPGVHDEDWPIAKSIIELHVASREYKMLDLLLDEYIKQMKELHRTAVRKDQVEEQFGADIAAIDNALAEVDKESEKWRDVVGFDRSLGAANGSPKNARGQREQQH